MTTTQLVITVCGIVVALIAFSLAKKGIRLILSIGTLIVTAVMYGILTPSQVIDTAKLIKDKGISAYESVVNSSEKIMMSGDSILVKFSDTWIDMNSVANYEIDGDTVTITVGGKDYSMTDKNVVKLFEMFE